MSKMRPCGIDASLKLASELLSGSDPYNDFLENTVVVIVPIFNVGGALNRDFVKLDSRNTRALTPVLREWKPDLFVDNHTSNGADYPYVR